MTFIKKSISSNTCRKLSYAGVNLIINIELFIELTFVLRQFNKDIVIPSRTYFIALFSYISRSLNVSTKLKIVLCHYKFLKEFFCPSAIDQIFKNGIVCWNENILGSNHSVILSNSKELEFEGSFSLSYIISKTLLYSLYFTFVPGSCFNIEEDTIIFISCSQGVVGEFENISKATKQNKDIVPAVILMKVLESIAILLNIRYGIGIGVRNQLSFDTNCDFKKFYSNYDEFWETFGGEKRTSQDFLITYPLYQKPIVFIKQKYRNRTIAKRNRLKEISAYCCNNFPQFLKNDCVFSSPAEETKVFLN